MTIPPHEVVSVVGAENAQLGSIFTAVHRQAYEVANSITEFDEQRDMPDEGEVYCHAQKWRKAINNIMISDRVVRVATSGYAPYLLRVSSLHPDEQPDEVVPSMVHTFGIGIDRSLAAELSQKSPDGLIVVEQGAPWREISAHRPTTEIPNLRKSDRERVAGVVTDMLGMLAATRCLDGLYKANRQLPTDKERLKAARTAVSDVFLLGSSRFHL